MRKIRGFKLNPRAREIQRQAKKAKLDLAALGLDSEAPLAADTARFMASVHASALYDCLPPGSSSLSPIPGLACSLVIVTLGPDSDAFIERERLSSPDRGRLFEIMAKAALDDATRFVLGLVEEEAKEERCELSPIQLLTEDAALKSAVSRLEGHKIGVAASDAGLRPVHTAAFSLSWLSRAKSRAT